jgi:hypothetical protein
MSSELEQAKSQSDQFDASRVPISTQIQTRTSSAYPAHTQQTVLRRLDDGEIPSFSPSEVEKRCMIDSLQRDPE